MHDDTPRMDPGELQAVREYLGLTGDALAGMLGVNPVTVRRWESGRDPIPHRVPQEVAEIASQTSDAVDELAELLRAADEPRTVVFRTDDDLHAHRPDMAHLTARWWRHVVVRACQQVDGVEIVSARPQ